jgi:hypothetical protein
MSRRPYLFPLAVFMVCAAYGGHRNRPKLHLACDPEIIGTAQSVNLHAHVSDGRPGVPVNFYAGDGWTPLGEAKTDSEGDADLEFSPGEFSDATGQMTITAWAVGYEDSDASLWAIDVEVDDVERDDLPDGVPPNMPSDRIEIRISPSIPDGHEIKLKIVDNEDSAAGSAYITDESEFTESATFTVTGGTQTEPGHSYGLKVKAYIDDAEEEVDSSGGFNVCAHPDTFSTKWYNEISGFWVGVWVTNFWESNSGDIRQLDKAWRSEVVEQAPPDNPPFEKSEDPPPPGYIKADLGSHDDRHKYPVWYINPTREGRAVFHQLFEFKCERCGVIDAACNQSGFEIVHSVMQSGGHWYHQAEKHGAAVTIGGNLSSDAGDGSAVSDRRLLK